MRRATPSSSGEPNVTGDPDAALARRRECHRSRLRRSVPGPHRVWPGTCDGRSHQRSDDDLLERHEVVRARNGVAAFLQMPRDRVRVIWMDGPQAYGRTAADDAGFEAAFLAREIGRPVRVQWTRQEETAWDTKGPAYAVKMRGALDATRQRRRCRLRRPRGRSQSSRLQRTRDGVDLATHGHEAQAAGARPCVYRRPTCT